MEISGDAIAYLAFLAVAAFAGREIWLHKQISKMQTNIDWLKNNIERRRDAVELRARSTDKKS